VGDTKAYARIAAAVPLLRYGNGCATAGESKDMDVGGVTTAAPSPGERQETGPQEFAFIRETLGLTAGTKVEMVPLARVARDRAYLRVAAAGKPSPS